VLPSRTPHALARVSTRRMPYPPWSPGRS
jgi:hypothetical protein